YLHRLLRRVDPGAAARLPKADRQRLVRALEVFFGSRRGLSGWIGESRYGAVKIGLNMDRAALYRIIDARVLGFFALGLVDEVRGLIRAGCPETANAFKAIGYHEALRHVRGEIGLDEAIA